MPAPISSASKSLRAGSRTLLLGASAIVASTGLAAAFLLYALPDANAFNARVERIFVETELLTQPSELRLLEVLAQSGTAFSEVLASYRSIIFILLIFATALLVAALLLLAMVVALNRRMSEIQRSGIEVRALRVLRAENAVVLNDMAFTLTPALIETLAALAEARMDDEFLTGAELEAVITGRPAADCDEAAGATRIKRLRDALGNQLIAELLVKNIARKGYTLAVEPAALRVE